MNVKSLQECSSCFRSSSSVTVWEDLSSRVLTTLSLCCSGWWELKCRYWSVCVFFLYTNSFTRPSVFRTMRVSRKGIWSSCSCSAVNLLSTEHSEEGYSRGRNVNINLKRLFLMNFMLRACGVDGLLLQWIMNLFSNRTFCSRVHHIQRHVLNDMPYQSVCLPTYVVGKLVFHPLYHRYTYWNSLLQ